MPNRMIKTIIGERQFQLLPAVVRARLMEATKSEEKDYRKLEDFALPPPLMVR